MPKGKGSVMKMAKAIASRHMSARHQRRAIEKAQRVLDRKGGR